MLSGGAPYGDALSLPLVVALGAKCTLNMSDSYGDGWNGAEWAAPSFGLSFSLAVGHQGIKSFVVQLCVESETCKDKDPSWCEKKLDENSKNEIRKKCKRKVKMKARCNKSCGNCDPYSCLLPSPSSSPPSPLPPLSSPVAMITTDPLTDAEHTDSTAALIGGGIAAVALLVFLCFASRYVPFAPVYTLCVSQTLLARSPTVAGHSQLTLQLAPNRPSTRAYVSAARKEMGSVGSLQSTTVSPALPSSTTASASAANTSTATASSEVYLQTNVGKGVLLDTAVRLRSGLSWYRPVRAQLLTAPEQAGLSEASAWSTLQVDGVIVQYEEVVGVRMDESVLEFIVEHKPRSTTAQDKPTKHIHLRMFTHSEFYLLRVALCPETLNPTLHLDAESKPSAVHAAHKWLVNAEAELAK
jgi:hypothetical protein